MSKSKLYFSLMLSLVWFFIASNIISQEKQKLSVEWIYSDEAQSITKLPNLFWLSNGKAIYFDSKKTAEERQIEILDPANGNFSAAFDMKKEIQNLQKLLGDKSPAFLPYPNAFNKSATMAYYIFSGDIFLLDLRDASFVRVTNTSDEEKNVNFSPDGKRLAFVRRNNIYIYDIDSKKEKALTNDGTETILNGTLSWVYWEEVFGRNDIAYWWSEDSKSLAYLQTDESMVSIMYYSDFKPWVPKVIKQRYPKIGDPNPVVKVGIADIQNRKTVWLDFSNNPYEYVIRVNWLPNSRQIAVETMNRNQDELNLLLGNASDGKVKHILKETDPGWVNVNDDLYFIKEGKEFLWMSERSGYAQLYRYSIDGKLLNQVTKGDWAVASSSGAAYWVHRSMSMVDENSETVYFTAQEKDPKEKHLYKIKYDGSGFERISNQTGTHKIYFSPDAKFYFDTFSNIFTPPAISLHKSDGTFVKQIASYDSDKLSQLDLQRPTQFTIDARDGFKLPAELMKPKEFDVHKKYPLIIYLYGGPSAPQVQNNWRNSVYFDQVLVDNGFLVAIIDPRSACAISKKLENLLTKNLSGDVELNDLLDAVGWLKKQSFIDSTRIGVWGWSGGGTFTLNAMTKSKEFKAGIAVAAVSDFRFYDTKFGEAAMKTELTNKEGLERNSFISSAKNLHGRLMLVHGTYDDNVHIQNAWAVADELIKANIMFDMMIYPMRMHGISDRPARIHLYNKMLEFWKANL